MSRGATWAKWDLHVHTPMSIEQGYGGNTDENWAKFIDDLEALDTNIKVLGINDYITLDGYKKVLEYKEQGRLANIECILPVVELRLSHFGGTEGKLSRVNFHVIFSDELKLKTIENDFLNLLHKDYDIGDEPIRVKVAKESLEEYGKKIKENTPVGRRSSKPDYKLGFDNLNFELKDIFKILEGPTFKNKYLTALGKTEWNAIRWKEQHIGDKKNIINKADILFIATNDPGQAKKDIASLVENKIKTTHVLDCSDSHYFTDSTEDNKIGNTFTWLNTDLSFNGLVHALNDYVDRVYIGERPHKLVLLERNPTNFLDLVKVNKKDGSRLDEDWFDFCLSLNPDLVAIIGNKGKGKSALADIIAHLGQSSLSSYFSFLNNKRFKEPKRKKANHFIGCLQFIDGSVLEANLDDKIMEGASERVRYLPQNYIDELCNEIDSDSEKFQREIEKVIFTHIPQENRSDDRSLTDFINRKSKVYELEIGKLQGEIRLASKKMASLLFKDTNEFKSNIENELRDKFVEYYNHLESKPIEIEEPNQNLEQRYSEKLLLKIISVDREKLKKLNDDYRTKKKEAAFLESELEELEAFEAQISSLEEGFSEFLEENDEFITRNELGSDIVTIKVKKRKLSSLKSNLKKQLRTLLKQVKPTSKESLSKKIKKLEARLERASSLSGFKEREYQKYLDELKEWENTLSSVVGDEGQKNTLAGLNLEYLEIQRLEEDLIAVKQHLINISVKIFKAKQEQLDIYRKSYEGVQLFINKYKDVQSELDLNFYADINVINFREKFFSYINQNRSSSFYGEKEGSELLGELLDSTEWEVSESVSEFLNRLLTLLGHNINKNDEKTEFVTLLKKNVVLEDFLEELFSLSYLKVHYSLRKGENKITLLSPGDKGLVLLVFYLLIDSSPKPLIIDQPEENLDNQTIKRALVPCLKEAKKKRQIIIVTHNPNLAVVCGANQIIYSDMDKSSGRNKVTYTSGSLQNPELNKNVVDVLEGTLPAFLHRDKSYFKK